MKFNVIIFLIIIVMVDSVYLQTEFITKFRPIFFEESYNFINFTTYCYFEGNKTSRNLACIPNNLNFHGFNYNINYKLNKTLCFPENTYELLDYTNCELISKFDMIYDLRWHILASSIFFIALRATVNIIFLFHMLIHNCL